MPDFILNGQAHGSVAEQLMANNFDVGSLRRFIGKDGRSYMTVNDGNGPDGKPKYKTLVTNTPATLRKDDWILLDEAVIRIARARLNAFADLRAASSFTIPNGMAKTVLEYEDMGDIGDATVSMDGLRQGDSDRPIFDLKSLPLPIIHKDFQFSARQVMASRNSNTPIDTTSAEMAARKVAEEAEKLTLGTAATYSYGGGTIYGYRNFPSRITKTDITAPSAGGWSPAVTVNEVLVMKSLSQAQYHYGPWALYFSPDWDPYLDDDYSAAKGDLTLRERLLKIEGITRAKTVDFLSGYTFNILMVQMTADVARAVVGMDVTTVQWESHGGMQLNFKVMAIWVPQLRADQNDNTGIVHGTTS